MQTLLHRRKTIRKKRNKTKQNNNKKIPTPPQNSQLSSTHQENRSQIIDFYLCAFSNLIFAWKKFLEHPFPQEHSFILSSVP